MNTNNGCNKKNQYHIDHNVKVKIDFYADAPENIEFIDGGFSLIDGIEFTGIHAKFRRNPNKNDLALIYAPEPVRAAGVFTKNKFCAAPVELCKERIASGKTRAVMINSGNANAATGELGRQNAIKSTKILADALGIKEEDILVCSTGVIGVQLKMECFEYGIPKAIASLGTDEEHSHAAARAIMTTDTVSKHAAVKFCATQSDGSEVTIHIAGIAKGSGMIEPDMATMISIIATDAAIEPSALKSALKEASDVSFNRVTIDSDTSTNDCAIALATGKNGGKTITEDCPVYPMFLLALKTLCVSLAKQIAADGEGATKLVTVEVSGAKDDEQAYEAAKSIANSPLVKTAIAGHDANWGRLAMALGKSNAEFKQENVSISIMGIKVCQDGIALEFDENEALKAFENDEILLQADLGCGEGFSRIWTCDLTHGYITINGDYRT